MQDEIIEVYEDVPVLDTKFLNAVRIMVGLSLSFGPFVLALWVWVLTNWYVALSSLLLFYILFGIISSKIRNSYIPYTQRERTYNTFELAAWWIFFHTKRLSDDDESH